MGSFLCLQFYSIDLPACHCTNTMRFLTLLLGNIAWGQGYWFPPEFPLLLRIVLTILGFLLFQMNLRIAFSNSMKNWVGIFDVDCVESVDCFWQVGHFNYVNPAHTRALKIFSIFWGLRFPSSETWSSSHTDRSLVWLESHQDTLYCLWLLWRV